MLLFDLWFSVVRWGVLFFCQILRFWPFNKVLALSLLLRTWPRPSTVSTLDQEKSVIYRCGRGHNTCCRPSLEVSTLLQDLELESQSSTKREGTCKRFSEAQISIRYFESLRTCVKTYLSSDGALIFITNYMHVHNGPRLSGSSRLILTVEIGLRWLIIMIRSISHFRYMVSTQHNVEHILNYVWSQPSTSKLCLISVEHISNYVWSQLNTCLPVTNYLSALYNTLAPYSMGYDMYTFEQGQHNFSFGDVKPTAHNTGVVLDHVVILFWGWQRLPILRPDLHDIGFLAE